MRFMCIYIVYICACFQHVSIGEIIDITSIYGLLLFILVAAVAVRADQNRLER